MGWFTNWITGGAEDDADEAIEDAKRLEGEARDEMNRMKEAYMDIDLSNPFANMVNQFEGMENQYADMRNQFAGLENTMEDLTVNQEQANFEAQQAQQNQSNIMEGMRGAAGGSGIAALAQSMAKAGQLASQQASASIGMQESSNQMAAAQQSANLQTQEARGAAAVDLQKRQGAAAVDLQRRQGAADVQYNQMAGEERAQGRQLDRAGTMYGISAQTLGGYSDQLSSAQQTRQDVTTNAWDSILPF